MQDIQFHAIHAQFHVFADAGYPRGLLVLVLRVNVANLVGGI